MIPRATWGIGVIHNEYERFAARGHSTPAQGRHYIGAVAGVLGWHQSIVSKGRAPEDGLGRAVARNNAR